jgi:zinc transport system ATP-binding protein
MAGHAPSHPHAHDHGAGCCEHHVVPQLGPLDRTALAGGRGITITRGGRTLLDRVDIDVHPREIVTLIGPNGAGKTTLVRALLGLEPLSAGELFRKPGLRIGYVPQRFDIDRALPMTVERFVSRGHSGRSDVALTVLDEAGAAHVAKRQLSEISGGELQRVALARALAANPELLVLDEPASGIDYQGEADLYTLIASLRDSRNLGILMVSHDLYVVTASSDRVICLNRHVCCSGIPEKVAQHPEYVRMFGAESARAFAVYRHHHDHRHDLDGAPHVEHEAVPLAPSRRAPS